MDLKSARERLTAYIAEKDAERGRPLTDVEKLENFWNALSEHDSDCATHRSAPCDCGADDIRKLR